MTWVKVATLEDLSEGVGVRVDLGGEPVALFRIDGDVFALSDTCSHAEASLSEGELFDEAVECPRHGSEFDVRTGKPRSLPATRPVAVFPTRITEGDIYVLMEDDG